MIIALRPEICNLLPYNGEEKYLLQKAAIRSTIALIEKTNEVKL